MISTGALQSSRRGSAGSCRYTARFDYPLCSVSWMSTGGAVIVQIGLIGDEAGDELRRLEQWLREDEDLRKVTITAQNAAMERGDMGPVLDALQVLLEPQGVLTALAASVGTWAGVRRRSVRIRVRSGEKEVEIDASRLRDPDDIATRILRELDGKPEA